MVEAQAQRDVSGHADDRAAKARTELVEFGKQLLDRGILAQTSGNMSVKLDNGRICITPARMEYHRLLPADMVVVGADGRVIEGSREPSSETRLHLTAYEARPDIASIVHTHSPFATTFAILGRSIPAVHYMIATLRVAEIDVAPYATYGSLELARNVRDAFVAPARAVLLANHGVVTGGDTLKEAADASETVELLAGLYHRALAVGEPNVLTRVQVDEVMAKQKAVRERLAAG